MFQIFFWDAQKYPVCCAKMKSSVLQVHPTTESSFGVVTHHTFGNILYGDSNTALSLYLSFSPNCSFSLDNSPASIDHRKSCVWSRNIPSRLFGTGIIFTIAILAAPRYFFIFLQRFVGGQFNHPLAKVKIKYLGSDLQCLQWSAACRIISQKNVMWIFISSDNKFVALFFLVKYEV